MFSQGMVSLEPQKPQDRSHGLIEATSRGINRYQKTVDFNFKVQLLSKIDRTAEFARKDY